MVDVNGEVMNAMMAHDDTHALDAFQQALDACATFYLETPTILGDRAAFITRCESAWDQATRMHKGQVK